MPQRKLFRFLLLAVLGLIAGFLALAVAVPIEPQVPAPLVALFSPGLKLAEFIGIGARENCAALYSAIWHFAGGDEWNLGDEGDSRRNKAWRQGGAQLSQECPPPVNPSMGTDNHKAQCLYAVACSDWARLSK
jgi:hypothetical protein